MIRYLFAFVVFFVAVGANAALYLRVPSPALPIEGNVHFILRGENANETAFNIPRRYLREQNYPQTAEAGRIDLIVAIQDFSPLPAPSPANQDDRLPDALTISLSLAQLGSVEPFQALYARFLTGGTTKLPSGLVKRRFRPGTPFEDRDLYIGAGSKLFVALCAGDFESSKEPCLTRLRQDGLDIQLRFDAKYLSQWQKLAGETSRLVSSLRIEP